MRCLTLAEKLKEISSDITFISRKLKGNLNYFILKKGIKVCELPDSNSQNKKFPNLEKDYSANWLGVSEEEDAKQTIHAIANKKPDWLIIDHYSRRKMGKKLKVV